MLRPETEQLPVWAPLVGTRFIGGEPKKVATKVSAGSS